eukprot:jgi/Astpho2/8823/Aster-05461
MSGVMDQIKAGAHGQAGAGSGAANTNMGNPSAGTGNTGYDSNSAGGAGNAGFGHSATGTGGANNAGFGHSGTGTGGSGMTGNTGAGVGGKDAARQNRGVEDGVQGNTASEAGVTHKGQTTEPNTEQRGIGQKLKDAVTSKNSAGNSANVNNPHHGEGKNQY